jgi:cytochrome P450 StaP
MINTMIERLNPFLKDFISDPYQFYDLYREADPIHWGISASSRLSGAWYIFRYKDVIQVLEDARFIREIHRVREDVDPVPVPSTYAALRSIVSNWMVFRDPPYHTRIRSLVNKAFSQKVIERIRPSIYKIVDSMLDKVHTKGEMDLVEEFAYPLPIMVIAALLGVNPEDRVLLRDWSQSLMQVNASRSKPPVEDYEKAERAAQSFIDYLSAIIHERRINPREDLISGLLKANIEENKLSDEEIISTCVHLLTAGHETTVNLISKGMLALLRNPEALEMLRIFPERIPAAVEELLRYDSPVQMVTRWASEDIEMDNKLIRRGDNIGLMIGSANRDPMRYKNPHILDLRRDDSRHCVFGAGIHFCVGSALARAESQIAFNILLNRLPEISLSEQTLVWPDTVVFYGPKKLKIKFRPPI